MRILWVKVGGLWPVNTGGRVRSFPIIAELSRRHEVIAVTTHGPGDDPQGAVAALPRCRQVVSFAHAALKPGEARFAGALLRSWVSPRPVHFWRWRVPALRRWLARFTATTTVDVCVVDFLHSTPNVPIVSVPTLFFAHNAEHIVWQRLARVERRAWWRAALAHEWPKVRRWEADVCAHADLTVAVSELDRDVLASLCPGACVRTIPTGVDPTYFVPNGVSESPRSLVFMGSMDWHPNEDGVLYFIDDVLPMVRREISDVSFTVVGRDPSPRVRTVAAAAGVRVTGSVDDVRPHVLPAAVFVVPLRVGGGTRLKIFEALAMGKAVVSTTIGAEGLPLVPGQHFVRADDPVEFAQATVALLRDPARRRALGLAGRHLVAERYSWAQVAQEFEARCEEAVVSHAR